MVGLYFIVVPHNRVWDCGSPSVHTLVTWDISDSKGVILKKHQWMICHSIEIQHLQNYTDWPDGSAIKDWKYQLWKVTPLTLFDLKHESWYIYPSPHKEHICLRSAMMDFLPFRILSNKPCSSGTEWPICMKLWHLWTKVSRINAKFSRLVPINIHVGVVKNINT